MSSFYKEGNPFSPGYASGHITAGECVIGPVLKQQEGKREDQGKPRMELLDAEFLEEMAKVMTKGAEKYSIKGECDCHVRNVSAILKFGPKDFVNLVTTQTIKKDHKDTRSIKRLIDNEIQFVYQNMEKSTSVDQDHRSTMKINEDTLPRKHIPLMMQDWMNSLANLLVQYAEELISCVSITTIKQEKLEKDYVKRVTLHLDLLNEKNGYLMHSDTCSSIKIIKTGAHNWRNGIHLSRTVASAYRHLGAFNRGEDLDKEFDLSHMAHLACNAMFLYWTLKHRKEYDDRFKY